jgi:hypothetical protein
MFDKPMPSDWPEGTEHSGFLLMGEAGNQSLYSKPRKINHDAVNH